MLVSLSTVFLTFLKLGSIGFGGPIALVALMERECVRKRAWISDGEFKNAYLFCKLLPGPVAYQMALWLGRHIRGTRGGIAAGIGFLIPGFVLIVGLSAAYTQVRSWSGFFPLVDGLRAAALALIAESVYRLALPYRSLPSSWGYALAGFAAMYFLPQWEPLIIISGGLAAILFRRSSPLTSLLFPLFWVHFKAGALVFGTGLAVLPVLQGQVVDYYHWISAETFLDAVAFGQVTPGPITITSAFIGHQIAGLGGGLAAVAGMYAPGTILVLLVVPLVHRTLRASRYLEVFGSGAIPVVIGCLAAASVRLGQQAIEGVASVILVAVALGLVCARVRVLAVFAVSTLLSFVLAYLHV